MGDRHQRFRGRDKTQGKAGISAASMMRGASAIRPHPGRQHQYFKTFVKNILRHTQVGQAAALLVVVRLEIDNNTVFNHGELHSRV